MLPSALQMLCFTDVEGVQIKEKLIGGACSTYESDQKLIHISRCTNKRIIVKVVKRYDTEV